MNVFGFREFNIDLEERAAAAHAREAEKQEEV
jgi:hypothetical protein